MSLLYPWQKDENSSKWKHKQWILLVIFPGYYSESYLSLSKHTCYFEETLHCKVYTFQFPPTLRILHAFVWRSLGCSLMWKIFCCKINFKASIFLLEDNHLTNASTQPPHISTVGYRCISSLESLWRNIILDRKEWCLFLPRCLTLKDVDF